MGEGPQDSVAGISEADFYLTTGNQMDITWEGLITIWKFIGLAFLAGFWLTAGMWAFCKGFGWAPVNITVQNIRND